MTELEFYLYSVYLRALDMAFNIMHRLYTPYIDIGWSICECLVGQKDKLLSLLIGWRCSGEVDDKCQVRDKGEAPSTGTYLLGQSTRYSVLSSDSGHHQADVYSLRSNINTPP